MKSVIILRGVSGSGKSTFANLIKDDHTEICCADDYFIDEQGNYNFDPKKLHKAHRYCFDKFVEAQRNPSINKIIVANTNTADWEFERYEEMARNVGDSIFYIVIENRHGSNDVHGVPEPVKEKQAKKLINSIELI